MSKIERAAAKFMQRTKQRMQNSDTLRVRRLFCTKKQFPSPRIILILQQQ